VRPESPEPEAPEIPDVAPRQTAAAALGSLSDLPVAGLTRRRIAVLIAALVAAWVIVLFARQVGEASEATARADAMAAHNAQLQEDVAGLEQELGLIQRQSYVAQAARGYRLGTPDEIPFTLAEDAPSLAPDAPGSASTRLGTTADRERPIDAWARLLFGDEGR
jgi:cell division protein FtsB